MFEADPQDIDHLVILDPGPSTLSKYIESMQLHTFDRTSRFKFGTSKSDNLDELIRSWPALSGSQGRTIALVTVRTDQDVVEFGQFPADLPQGLEVLALTGRPLQRATKGLVVQGIPESDEGGFALKVGGHLARLVRGQRIGSVMNPESDEFPKRQRASIGLAEFRPLLDEPSVERVCVDGVAYDFISKLNSNSQKLLVVGQSALHRATSTLPLFQRWKWMRDYDGSVVVLNDPTLYMDQDLDCGWWVGTTERDYVPEFLSIIRKIVASLEISTQDVVFYGGSAGGFASLHMAACLPGARAIVDIPQTDLREYHLPAAVDAVAVHALGCASIQDVPAPLLHRISVLERFRQQQRVPDFLYLQNNKDNSHFRSQFGKFICGLVEMQASFEWARNTMKIETYSAWSFVRGGHFPLNRFDTMRHINNYFINQ